MAMKVELGADDRAGTDQGANSGEQIALAVIIVLCRHRAVKVEQDHVERQGGADLVEDFVAQRFIDTA